MDQLKNAERVELGNDASLWPAYLRGLAYLQQGADAHAQLEFQKILDHKGVLVPKDFNPAAMTLYPLASPRPRPRRRPQRRCGREPLGLRGVARRLEGR